MKLSEAIRLGAMMRPQTFFQLEDDKGTCALGAARMAIGIDNCCALAPDNPREWKAVLIQPCPLCGRTSDRITVAHLNDQHRWTREQIADWIEQIELAQETAAEQPAASSALQDLKVG